jgi:hypothetical protein
MKKLLFMFSMLFVFALAGMAFTTGDMEVVNAEEVVSLVEESEVSVEEEALYCKVTNGDVEVECWFCNCRKLADSLE